MIEKYYSLNIKFFYADFEANKARLERFKLELEEMVESSGGVDYSEPRVSGGNLSDTTASIVSRRLKLEAKIKGLEEYFQAEKLIENQMTEEEKAIIERHLKGNEQVSTLADKMGYSQKTMYQKIKELKKKIWKISAWEQDFM